MQAIMYHYVREFDNSIPNQKFLNYKNFEKQLDMFEEKFGFVQYDEWLKCITNKSIDNLKKKVVLTFDDATFCHYKYVYKILKKKNYVVFFMCLLLHILQVKCYQFIKFIYYVEK